MRYRLKKESDAATFTEICNSLLCYNKNVINLSELIVRIKYLASHASTSAASVSIFERFSKFLPALLQTVLSGTTTN